MVCDRRRDLRQGLGSERWERRVELVQLAGDGCSPDMIALQSGPQSGSEPFWGVITSQHEWRLSAMSQIGESLCNEGSHPGAFLCWRALEVMAYHRIHWRTMGFAWREPCMFLFPSVGRLYLPWHFLQDRFTRHPLSGQHNAGAHWVGFPGRINITTWIWNKVPGWQDKGDRLGIFWVHETDFVAKSVWGFEIAGERRLHIKQYIFIYLTVLGA